MNRHDALELAEVIPSPLVDQRLVVPPPVPVVTGARSHLGVVIGCHPGWRPLRVDVHVPAVGTAPFPVLVYAHGGGFVGGVKEMGPWGGLPAAGIAVVSVEYRLAGEANFPAVVEDVASAIRWARSPAAGELGLDVTRVAGWGSSAGGYLLGRAALWEGSRRAPIPEGLDGYSCRLDAVVLHHAPVDLRPLVDEFGTVARWRPRIESTLRLLHDVALEDADLDDVLGQGSILDAVAAAETLPPFHVAHGDADLTVPHAQSVLLRDAVRRRGGTCELVTVEGEGHASAAFAHGPVVQDAVRFLWSKWGASLPTVAGPA